MNLIRRFFNPEPKWSPHFVAYALVAGLIYVVSWAAFLLAIHFGAKLTIWIWEVTYASPEAYLLFSVLPWLAIWLVYVAGLAVYSLVDFLRHR